MTIRRAKEGWLRPMPRWRRLPAEAAARLANDPDVVFVDVRDQGEREKTGTIKGAAHAPRAFLEFLADPASERHLSVFSSDKRFVLFCASGGRSALAAKTLKDMGLARVAHIAGGLPAWTARLGARSRRSRKAKGPASKAPYPRAQLSNSAALAAASPTLLIAPTRSVSPDW
jgi:rhodanese-related sulfurtransferase